MVDPNEHEQDSDQCCTCDGEGQLRCLAHQAGDGCEEGFIPCPDCRQQEELLKVVRQWVQEEKKA